jgi:SAM-dependent methyltransferase
MLDIFRGKTILEAGCGAGRFTEIMLGSGGYVFAADLSSAVDANYKNCSASSNYFICQADIVNLPVHPEQFDVVVCVGVIQHTPDPETTIKALCSYVKPGGMLMIDHYTQGYPTTPSRRWLRSYLLTKQEEYSMRFVNCVVDLFWPLHKFFYNHRSNSLIQKLYPHFLYWSPVVDYHYDYSQLGEKLMYEWSLLDTHDTLTDRYKHLRSAEEIESALKASGMIKVETVYAGNGVEARAWKQGN